MKSGLKDKMLKQLKYAFSTQNLLDNESFVREI